MGKYRTAPIPNRKRCHLIPRLHESLPLLFLLSLLDCNLISSWICIPSAFPDNPKSQKSQLPRCRTSKGLDYFLPKRDIIRGWTPACESAQKTAHPLKVHSSRGTDCLQVASSPFSLSCVSFAPSTRDSEILSSISPSGLA